MINGAAEIAKQLQFSIANIGFELSWEGSQPADEPSLQFYRAFASEGEAQVRLRVACGQLPELNPESMIFDAVENHWQLSRLNGQHLFEIFDTVPPHHRVQLALMDSDFRSGRVYRRPQVNLPSGTWSLGRLMRTLGQLLLIHFLGQDQGCLIHALGVSDRGEGRLFIGHSGAGKTTLANLYKPCSDANVLGDERVVVTRRQGGYWLSGTPWPGTAFTVSAETVPLRSIYFLEHGSRNVLKAERPVNLSGLFFQQLFLPFWNGQALQFSLELVDQLISAVPTCRLSFVNDRRVIEFLRSQE